MPFPASPATLAGAAPLIFVLLWSTGFIGAKLGLPHAEPFTFLSLRLALTLVLLSPAVWRLPRPSSSLLLHSMVTGFLVHGVYLGGVFFAISRGLPAGVCALVVALQPLATALAARGMLGERLSRVQLLGFVAGLVGAALVIAPGLAGGAGVAGATPVTLGAAVIAVLGISFGAVYQKRYAAGLDIRIATAAQYLGALAPLAALAWFGETMRIDWTGEFVFALGWLVLVLSIGAVGLLMWLIRVNSAASTASLFYLVPAVTSLIAWALFGERLQPVQLAGMAIVMVAVYLATRTGAREK